MALNMQREENRPLNYAGLALAMIVGALGIVAINLYSSGDFVEAALIKRARAHFADSLVSARWLHHELGVDNAASLAVPVSSALANGIAVAGSHQVRLVSARPLNPGNSPDIWENEALQRFANGIKEANTRIKHDQTADFRYMAPLYIETSCLSCHAKQGFKVGELAGGLAVSFDASDTDLYYRNNAIATVIAIVLIMFGVGQVMAFSVRRVRELGRMADRERERFESIVQAMDGVVWEADPKSLQFSFVSRRAVQLLGYPESDWLEPGFWVRHLHPEDKERAIAQRKKEIYSTDSSEIEYRFLNKDGVPFWFNDRVRIVHRSDKSSVLRGIMIDVTARKRVEVEAGKLLRAVEQSPASIVITDRNGVIEYVNPRFTQNFGYTREEAIGKNPRILKSGETPLAIYKTLWMTILSGKEWRGRLKNRCKNGDTIWEDVSIAPLVAENNEITHFLAVKEDVTDRLRVEKELDDHRNHLEDQVRARTQDLVLAVQKATAADRAKSEFLTNMSHEIRTPLNAVIGFCELVLRTELTPQQRDYLDKIDGAGQHLLQLINNLLDLSKIAAGRVELATSALDLPQLMARIGSVLSYKAVEKGISFDMAVDADLPRHLLGDGLRVNQVLFNLVNNAIKFTEKGSVRVEVRRLHQDEKFVRIRFVVEDSGIGMDAKELQRAFEPFAQGDATISRKYGGTGLGLSISRDLIGLMGGQLEASSEKGLGSRFAFALDFSVAEAESPSGTEGPGNRLSSAEEYRFPGLRVLLVDDQPLNRLVAGEMLHACEVEFEAATNGKEAVDCLFAQGPQAFDVVLMDLQMPEFDGLSAMRAIRAQAGFENLPIVAMTAHVLEEERRVAIAAGANGHLGKPFHSEQLYEMLARFAPSQKMKRISKVAVALPVDQSATHTPNPAVLDWQEGIDRLNGRAEKYLIWLRRFAEERRGVSDEAAALLNEGKIKETAQLIHALKGSAGMLGLKRVFEAARVLEMSCRETVSGEKASVPPSDVDNLRSAIIEANSLIAGLNDPPGA